MFDMMKMMKQLGDVQSKMQAAQDALSAVTVTGSAGGGLVTVTMTGRSEMKGIVIDPSLLSPSEKEMLEDLIIAATSDAQNKAADAAKEKMASVTAGLPIPPGMMNGLKM
jgi:nucleoid-associated protein EbfC